MCVDHVGAGEFTIHFSPGDRGLYLPSLAKKVNAPLMPEGGGGGGSNDWCISKTQHFSTLGARMSDHCIGALLYIMNKLAAVYKMFQS